MSEFEKLGRVVSRGRVTAGLWLPLGTGLPEGLFEVRQIMGELVIVSVGPSAMQADSSERYTGLSLSGVFNERPYCCMTHEELNALDPRNK
jgi:hypothetical protein